MFFVARSGCALVDGSAGVDGYCLGNYCYPPKANGEACAENYECDGVCASAICVDDCDVCGVAATSPGTGCEAAPSYPLDAACSATGRCDADARCVEPIGVACQADYNCMSKKCLGGVCSENVGESLACAGALYNHPFEYVPACETTGYCCFFNAQRTECCMDSCVSANGAGNEYDASPCCVDQRAVM